MTGKTYEEIIESAVGKLIDEQIAAEMASSTPTTTTTVTAYKVKLSDDAKNATLVTLSPVSGRDSWSTIGLFYPQMPEKDDYGNKIVHNLTQGNSSFPIRGIVTCTQNIDTVKAVVTNNSTGAVATQSSRSGINAKWFDLWGAGCEADHQPASAGYIYLYPYRHQQLRHRDTGRPHLYHRCGDRVAPGYIDQQRV